MRSLESRVEALERQLPDDKEEPLVIMTRFVEADGTRAELRAVTVNGVVFRRHVGGSLKESEEAFIERMKVEHWVSRPIGRNALRMIQHDEG